MTFATMEPAEHDLYLKTAPGAAFVLRAALALVFLAHGVFKVAVLGLAANAQFFASQGFPGWLGLPVAVLELAGGALLLLGVATRPVSLLLVAVCLGALRVHAANGWYFGAPNGGWEFLAVLIAALVALALLGPGRWRVARSLA